MANHRLPRVVFGCCAFGVLALFAAVAAAAGSRSGAAGGSEPNAPRITGLKVVALSTTGKLAPCPDTKGPRQPGSHHTKTARAPSQPCVEAAADQGTRASFRLAIVGENLAPEGAPAPAVRLDTEDPGHPVTNTPPYRVDAKEIDVTGEALVPTTITRVTVSIGGGTCIDPAGPPACRSISSPPGSTISIAASPAKPAQALREFQVKMDHQTNTQLPNLHSLVLTRQSGDDGAGFAAKASLMQVDLEPTGASDLRIVQSNQQQMELHFVAAADYAPKSVAVTVFDSSDLDRRAPCAIGTLAVPKDDPNAPTISDVKVDFVDRALGRGRIHIYGTGFGTGVTRPGYPVEEYLADCLEPPRDAEVNRSAGAKERASCTCRKEAWTQFQESVRGRATVVVGSRNPAIRVEKTYIIDMNDSMLDLYFEFTRHQGYSWPFRLSGVDLIVTKDVKTIDQVVRGDGVSAEVDDLGPATYAVAHSIGPQRDPNLTYQYTILDYDGARNQLGSIVADNFYVVELSVVNTGTQKVSVPLAGIQAEVEWLYGYGKTRWYNDKGAFRERVQEFFIDGPPTLAPIPVAAVSGYFGSYQTESGRRVRTFNILAGITTLVTALVPFAGPSLKDAEVVFSGGFIPGLGQAWPDLSPQQLQHLTSLSWGDTETVAANGGSVSKYVYIQRTRQFNDTVEPTAFSSPPGPSKPAAPCKCGKESRCREACKCREECKCGAACNCGTTCKPGSVRLTTKQISNILNIEVTGWPIPDTPAVEATPQTPASQPTGSSNSQPSGQ
jgi:hypothetical protein